MGSGHSTTKQQTTCTKAELQTTYTKQPVFKSEESAAHVYRIPALVYESESKTLLAFAEQRRTSNDAHGEMLVMRTGKVKEESSVKTIVWSELKQVEKAHIDAHRPMNPCPVYDKDKKKLFLFFICVEDSITEHWQIKYYCNKARLCYITSEDFGETWSNVTDLTDKLHKIKDWATFAVGPGHGIQTEENKYRLIVPVHAYYFCCSTCCVLYCSCNPAQYALSLYSDDSGENWTFGEMFSAVSGECEMAEVSKNCIYCNARNVKGYRVEAVSHDHGVNFKTLESNLVETGSSGCQGSVVSFPAQNESANTESDPNPKWLLFTHPTDKSKRTNLGVYLNTSPLDANTWSKPVIINDGPSGYSDLAYIDDGWFACLFECGKDEIHEQIVSTIFSYDDVKKDTGE